MSQAEPWTVGRLLTWTTDYLKKNGADSPRLDAEVLLAQSLGCQRIELYTAYNESVDEDVRALFREYVRRRAAGEPVAYIVGHREFYSLPFKVTPYVLIPRPETEHLIVETLDVLHQSASQDEVLQIIDVGTGSGAIAVTLAVQAKNCRVAATDVSADALAVARENAESNDVADRISFHQCDLMEGLDHGLRCHAVVSNPPYVSRAEWEQLSAGVKDHEPYEALVGGDSGVETIARLVPQAAVRLRDDGWFLCEISPMIEAATRQCVAETGDFEQVETVKDLAGLTRVIKARRRARAA